MGFSHFDRSACLVQPMTLVKMSPEWSSFEFRRDVTQPTLVSILDLQLTQGQVITWRSPAWQIHTLGDRALPPGIRGFFRPGTVQPLRIVLADHAWFRLVRSVVEKFLTEAEVAVEPGSSFVAILFAGISKLIPALDEGAVMRRIALRMSADEANLTFADDLLEVNEAYEFISRPDVEKVKAAQKASETASTNCHNFQSQFMEFHRERRASKRAEKDGGKGKGGRPAAVVRYALPVALTQPEAKAHVPEGSSIWRGHCRSEWCGHCPPFGRVHAAVLEHGDIGACRQVLRSLWRQHCLLVGDELIQCPIRNLFTQEELDKFKN
jgi:hypothetical protein